MLTLISHHLQTNYFSHKLSFIMDNDPWEFPDINNSDLPSCVRSSDPNLSSSSSRALIFGPAKVIQAVMMNRQSRESLRT